jgi:hypothetical protein
MLERLNEEINRKISCLRLIRALPVETHGMRAGWRPTLNKELFKPHKK